MTSSTTTNPGHPGLRFFFLFDTLVIYTLILWTVWSTNLNPAVLWFWPTIATLLLYLGIGSPLLQQYLVKRIASSQSGQSTIYFFFEDRGIGNPFNWVNKIRRQQAIRKIPTGIFFTTLILIIFCAAITIATMVKAEKLAQTYAIAMPVLLLLCGGSLLTIVRWDNFIPALKSVRPFIFFGLAIITAAHVLLRYYSPGNDGLPLATSLTATELWANFSLLTLFSKFFLYLPWSWIQMYFFLAVIHTSLSRTFGDHCRLSRSASVITTGFLFALIHLPNIWLFCATLLAGIYLAHCYSQNRNVFVAAVPHALFACLFSELLPFSLSPMIRNYEGPAFFYEQAKLVVFFSLPVLLIAGTLAITKFRKPSLIFISIIFSVLVLVLHPNNGDTPLFSWSRYGNAHAWPLHDLKITERDGKSTSYQTTGRDPYFQSQPINLNVKNQLAIELRMELTTINAKTRTYLYFDTGKGFENSIYKPLPLALKPGLNTYSVSIPYSGYLARLRIDPTTQANVGVIMQSLKVTADARKL
jgi:hypothetical protein